MPFDPAHHVFLPRPIDPDAPHTRIMWAPPSDDLHLNMVHLLPGEAIGGHTNATLDVVYTVLDGSATLTIDGETVNLSSGIIVVVPRGATRELIAGPDGIIYTTCHRKRGGIMPTVPQHD